ncbi:MAG TPA: helix-turn-helix transcriptional regulator [Thermoanaerobaculia bacterium]|nr:helix-turn-helix transcriptional regulator [Thermoanaerobaculia bacterium]
MNADTELKGQSQLGLRKELGRRIVAARRTRGWSQGELARRLGVPRDRVSKWERGCNAPTLQDLAALSEVLEVPLGRLGLGLRERRTISPEEMTEMLFHFSALARLLKPWREREAEGGRRKKA